MEEVDEVGCLFFFFFLKAVLTQSDRETDAEHRLRRARHGQGRAVCRAHLIIYAFSPIIFQIRCRPLRVLSYVALLCLCASLYTQCVQCSVCGKERQRERHTESQKQKD